MLNPEWPAGMREMLAVSPEVFQCARGKIPARAAGWLVLESRAPEGGRGADRGIWRWPAEVPEPQRGRRHDDVRVVRQPDDVRTCPRLLPG
jgi:hypothetical protein